MSETRLSTPFKKILATPLILVCRLETVAEANHSAQEKIVYPHCSGSSFSIEHFSW